MISFSIPFLTFVVNRAMLNTLKFIDKPNARKDKLRVILAANFRLLSRDLSTCVPLYFFYKRKS